MSPQAGLCTQPRGWVPGPGLGLNWQLALCHLGAGTCPRRAEITP